MRKDLARGCDACMYDGRLSAWVLPYADVPQRRGKKRKDVVFSVSSWTHRGFVSLHTIRGALFLFASHSSGSRLRRRMSLPESMPMSCHLCQTPMYVCRAATVAAT
ncbi:hypothetical protein F4774DRAFT_270764 [Daldinia eschscholtzii]|nr:hypothetical protein F4774DRAFT_270764 [Daldinia eschscholtzii]